MQTLTLVRAINKSKPGTLFAVLAKTHLKERENEHVFSFFLNWFVVRNGRGRLLYS
jgi:hypothetical protein